MNSRLRRFEATSGKTFGLGQTKSLVPSIYGHVVANKKFGGCFQHSQALTVPVFPVVVFCNSSWKGQVRLKVIGDI